MTDILKVIQELDEKLEARVEDMKLPSGGEWKAEREKELLKAILVAYPLLRKYVLAGSALKNALVPYCEPVVMGSDKTYNFAPKFIVAALVEYEKMIE